MTVDKEQILSLERYEELVDLPLVVFLGPSSDLIHEFELLRIIISDETTWDSILFDSVEHLKARLERDIPDIVIMHRHGDGGWESNDYTLPIELSLQLKNHRANSMSCFPFLIGTYTGWDNTFMGDNEYAKEIRKPAEQAFDMLMERHQFGFDIHDVPWNLAIGLWNYWAEYVEMRENFIEFDHGFSGYLPHFLNVSSKQRGLLSHRHKINDDIDVKTMLRRRELREEWRMHRGK